MASTRIKIARVFFEGKSAILVTILEGTTTQEAVQKMLVPMAKALEIKPEQILVFPPDVDVDACCFSMSEETK